MGVSEELGGIVSITAGVIIITGVLGNILAEVVLKVFRITEPVAKGIALGTSAHAIGTAKAMELGELGRPELEHCARRVLELILKID